MNIARVDALYILCKIKKCAYRSKRTKNANPDSRQTNLNRMGITIQAIIFSGICVFDKFINTMTQ